MCCSVLQFDAVCCSVLQCVAVCCSVTQCVTRFHVCHNSMTCVTSRVAMCCSALQFDAVCCIVLQCVTSINEIHDILVCAQYAYSTKYTDPLSLTRAHTRERSLSLVFCLSLSQSLTVFSRTLSINMFITMSFFLVFRLGRRRVSTKVGSGCGF